MSEKTETPVCKIIDYGKCRFEQRKTCELPKKQHISDVKEAKIHYIIEEHDYDVCINRAERFLKYAEQGERRDEIRPDN